MSKRYAEIAKEKYELGEWTLNMIRRLVDMGRLTRAEFKDVTGQDY